MPPCTAEIVDPHFRRGYALYHVAAVDRVYQNLEGECVFQEKIDDGVLAIRSRYSHCSCSTGGAMFDDSPYSDILRRARAFRWSEGLKDKIPTELTDEAMRIILRHHAQILLGHARAETAPVALAVAAGAAEAGVVFV